MTIKWFKNSLPWAIGNSMVDHVSMAKQKISSHKSGNNIKIGLVYDDSIDFHKDLIKFNSFIDYSKTLKEYVKEGSKEFLNDPTGGLSWNYLIKNNEIARFRAPKKEMQETEKILLNYGIDPGKDKIIAIHAREPGYKHYPDKNRHPHRFVDIKTFIKFSEHYLLKGYKIIRIGDSSSTPFPPYKNLLDTSIIKNKSLIHDICFINHSTAFVGTDSGMWLFGVAIGIPTLLTNNCHGIPGIGMKRWWFPWEDGHGVIHKNPYKNGKLVSGKTACNTFDGMGWSNTKNIILKDNSFEQINLIFKNLLKARKII